jgi:hypothetical protein
MRRDEAWLGVAARDEGLRRVSRLTWRTAAVAVACSAVIAAAFGHATRHAQAGRTGSGTIVIPAQPPKLTKGAGQVTSGAS